MKLLRPVAVAIGARPWMPRFLPAITWLDVTVHRLTRGRFGLLDLAGLPSLLMTVPGRRTGTPRTTPLLCVPHDGGFLVAGSNWGQAAEPMWVRNLETAGAGDLTFRGRRHAFTARVLEGDERAAAWTVLNGTWPNFARYAQRTQRPIKVFRLTPVG